MQPVRCFDADTRDIRSRALHVVTAKDDRQDVAVRFVNRVRRGPSFHIKRERGLRHALISLVVAGGGRLRIGTERWELGPGMA